MVILAFNIDFSLSLAWPLGVQIFFLLISKKTDKKTSQTMKKKKKDK